MRRVETSGQPIAGRPEDEQDFPLSNTTPSLRIQPGIKKMALNPMIRQQS
jgi:hypothetical protein